MTQIERSPRTPVEERPISGMIRDMNIRWITLEMTREDYLYIFTLYGHKVIKDVEKSKEILKVLSELMDEGGSDGPSSETRGIES